MKSSEGFKQVISQHLESRAAKDPLFAETLKKPAKNIDDCVTYILNQVKASGCVGFADDEIFGMAVHYYDEDDIKPGSKIECKVVVNHSAEITEEDKEKAKQAAFDRIVIEEQTRIKKKADKKEQVQTVQHSLF